MSNMLIQSGLGRRTIRSSSILKARKIGGVIRGGQPFLNDFWENASLPPPGPTPSDTTLLKHLDNLFNPIDVVTYQNLRDVGCQFGHRTYEWNAAMSPFIFGERKGYHVIDLHYTTVALRNLIRCMQYICLKGGKVLWVNFNREKNPMFFHYAEKSRQPFMFDKWRPGLFSNYHEVLKTMLSAKRVQYEEGNAADIRKKRMVSVRRLRAIEAFSVPLDGKLPSMVFFIDSHRSRLMLKECLDTQIPTAGVVDTNCDPTHFMYPIPMNDDNDNANAFVLDAIATGLKSVEDYKDNLRTKGICFEPLEIGNRLNIKRE